MIKMILNAIIAMIVWFIALVVVLVVLTSDAVLKLLPWLLAIGIVSLIICKLM